MIVQINNLKEALLFRLECRSYGIDAYEADLVNKENLTAFLNSVLGLVAGVVEAKNLQILQECHTKIGQLCSMMQQLSVIINTQSQIAMGKASIQKFHTHVYTVTGLQEIDLECNTPEEAKQKALQYVADNPDKFKDPECKVVALVWNK